MTTGKAAKRYLREVERHLACSRHNRTRIMGTVRHALNAYLEDEPQAGFDDLVHALGEPKAFAESLLSKVPAVEIEAARKAHHLRFRSAVIAFAVVITVALVVLGGFYLKYQDSIRGDFIVNEVSIIGFDNMTHEELIEYSSHLDREWLEETNQ